MPQATEEQRAQWGEDGGCGEGKATDHLESQGFNLLPGFVWRKPNPDYEITEDDRGALDFLIDEWDFGDAVD